MTQKNDKLHEMAPQGQDHLQLPLRSTEGKRWPHAYFRHLLQSGQGDNTGPRKVSFSPLATKGDQPLGLDGDFSISSGEPQL